MIGMRLKIIIVIIAVNFITSCSGIIWQLEKTVRKPGEKIVNFPEKVAVEYKCSEKKLPFFYVERNELSPTKINPGTEINHHFVYVMCPSFPSEVIDAKLYRRIYYQGKIVFEDITENFKIKPGRWEVNAYIIVPPEATTGVYSLEMEIRSNKIRFKDAKTFVILGGEK